MYENVIVPFDGTLPARAVLAPAADLAWRAGARVVIVTDTDANDQESRALLKSKAMSLSGADVDFWVDAENELGDGVVEAAKHRGAPVIAIPVRTRPGGLRRRPVLGSMPAKVLLTSPVPVMVIGPETDVSRGLPMTEVVVPLDGSEAAEQALPLAVAWARAFKLRVILAGVVRDGAGVLGVHNSEAAYLDAKLAGIAGSIPEGEVALLESADPAQGLCGLLADHDSAVIIMSTHGRSGVDGHPLGSVAQGVLLHSPRAMVFRRPT